jgi:hypothetical protein
MGRILFPDKQRFYKQQPVKCDMSFAWNLPFLKCRVVQLVAHQILDLGVLGSSPSAAAILSMTYVISSTFQQ